MKLLSIRRFPSSTAWWITIWHFSAFMIEEMTFRYCNFFFLLTTCPIFSFPHANISQISNLLDVNLVLIWVRGLFLSFNDSFVDIKWLYKKKKHYWNVFVVENEWKSKHCPKKNLRKTLGKSRELLIRTILKHSKKSGSKKSGWRNGIRLLQSTVSQWELVINILIWKKLFNVLYEVALQTVQSVIWKEINTQLNMLNIKFYLLFENWLTV